jgi:hypothetical protein
MAGELASSPCYLLRFMYVLACLTSCSSRIRLWLVSGLHPSPPAPRLVTREAQAAQSHGPSGGR